jgi:hypothetical protein
MVIVEITVSRAASDHASIDCAWPGNSAWRIQRCFGPTKHARSGIEYAAARGRVQTTAGKATH